MSSDRDELPGGVVSLSADLRIRAANRAMGDLVDRDPATLVGRSFDVLLSAPSRILFQTHVYPALRADGRVEEVFLTLAAPEDGVAPEPILLNAIRSELTGGYECLIVRVLARARWEKELLEATQAIAAEQAATRRLTEDLKAAADDLAARHAVEQREREFRDAFIGVVSHELRTPITTIFGMSHILHDRFQTMAAEEVREHLADIRAESSRLRRLTEDLLVLGRTEGGRLEVAVDPIVVAHAIAAAVETQREGASTHRFSVAVSPDLPLAQGDDLFVEQVLRNYLSNAVKYSPPDTVVQLDARAEDDGVAIRVIDEGPGFGAQRPERLFDLFFRSPDAIRSQAGAGIGLFVCRELARAMGGRVWARNRVAPERGAEFGMWLRQVDEAVEP